MAAVGDEACVCARGIARQVFACTSPWCVQSGDHAPVRFHRSRTSSLGGCLLASACRCLQAFAKVGAALKPCAVLAFLSQAVSVSTLNSSPWAAVPDSGL